jgi:hypothetical protein
MPSTLNPACPLCGLRFENKPLLDLHSRDDHQRVFRAGDAGDAGDAGEAGNAGNGESTRPTASEVHSTPDPHPAATPSRTPEDAAPGQPDAVGRAKTALRRAWSALRDGARGIR